MSLRARFLSAWLRRFEKPFLARTVDPVPIRHRFDLTAKYLFHAPRGTQMQWQALEAGQRRVDALEIVPQNLNCDAVLFYIHGGAFVFGSPNTHAAMLAALCKRLGARAILPRYGLAPETPYPAAPSDVRTAWEGLCASGVAPQNIIVGGDSAGGALALSLLAELVAEKASLPAGLFCFSPLTDLTYSGESFTTNAEKEALLPASRARESIELYLQTQDPADPAVSPLFADFAGACPVWLTVGDTEILRDDSRRLARRLSDEKVRVTFEEHPDLPHVWPLFHNTLPEARQTLDSLAVWIRQQAPETPAGN